MGEIKMAGPIPRFFPQVRWERVVWRNMTEKMFDRGWVGWAITSTWEAPQVQEVQLCVWESGENLPAQNFEITFKNTKLRSDRPKFLFSAKKGTLSANNIVQFVAWRGCGFANKWPKVWTNLYDQYERPQDFFSGSHNKILSDGIIDCDRLVIDGCHALWD